MAEMEEGRGGVGRERPGGLGPEPKPAIPKVCGVVFVHGVGAQRKSEFLLDLANPIADWLQQWHLAHGGVDTAGGGYLGYLLTGIARFIRSSEAPLPRVGPETGEVALSFAPADIGLGDLPSLAVLDVPGERGGADRWYFAEAWWAASNRRAEVRQMLPWALKYLGRGAWHVGQLLRERLRHFVGEPPTSTAPNHFVRLLDILYAFGYFIFYLLTMVIGLLLLVPVLILSKLPIPSAQDFVMNWFLRPFVEVNMGEFRANLEDEFQAANMRRRVAEAIKLLVSKGCEDVVLVVHSEGVVPTHGMLTDDIYTRGEYAEARQAVKKVIAMGSALNLSWSVAPRLERLHRRIPDGVLWKELWASFDPVTSGAPRQGTAFGMASNDQVTNEMSVVSDHGAYWQNDEQVVVRLVAEIDTANRPDGDHTESRFWRGAYGQPWPEEVKERRTEGMRVAVQHRRKRVTVLAVSRALLFAAWVGACAAWLAGYRPLGGVVSRVLQWIYQGPLPDWIAAFLIYGVIAFALYAVVVRYLLWDPYNRWARSRAIAMMANTSRIGWAPEGGRRRKNPDARPQYDNPPPVELVLPREMEAGPKVTRQRVAQAEPNQPKAVGANED